MAVVHEIIKLWNAVVVEIIVEESSGRTPLQAIATSKSFTVLVHWLESATERLIGNMRAP